MLLSGLEKRVVITPATIAVSGKEVVLKVASPKICPTPAVKSTPVETARAIPKALITRFSLINLSSRLLTATAIAG